MLQGCPCPNIDLFVGSICQAHACCGASMPHHETGTNRPALAGNHRCKCTSLFRLAEDTTPQIYLFRFASSFD
jgi:hypothetical protein